MNTGENVKRRREELGLSLSNVADAAGISKGGLHDLENQPNVRPSAELLYRISTVLQCSMEYLLGVPRFPCSISTEGNALAIQNLSFKKRLRDIAKAIAGVNE